MELLWRIQKGSYLKYLAALHVGMQRRKSQYLVLPSLAQKVKHNTGLQEGSSETGSQLASWCCDAEAVNIHILAWFVALRPILDRMPDQPWYQAPAPDKKEVWRWYMAAVRDAPNIWKPCTYAYFIRVWRENVSAIRLRSI